MKNSIILVITALIFLSGCVPMQPKVSPIDRPEFPIDEYKNLPKEGTGIVEGQAFLKTRGGDVKTAAGNYIQLNPVTSYSDFWYENNYVKHLPLKKVDSRINDYLIKKLGDASGRFKFKNVPPGDYYVGADITWEAATGYNGALQKQGGFVAKRITVKNGQTTEVIITNNP